MASFRNRLAPLVLVAVLAAACGDDAVPEGPGGRTPDLANAFAWVADSDVAGDLLPCVDPRRGPSSCTIGRLPPIAWREGTADAAAVLERVVVSHPWMGERFEAILARLPEELHRVLGAVTAIVIDDDVRPSFYWTLTGAIYVDPRHLWLTPEEEATISDEPDYRSGFGADLLFVPFSSYLTGGIDEGVDPQGRRDLEGRIPAMAALLFHEGAHANDFLPPGRIGSLDAGETLLAAVERLEGQGLSDRLVAETPLRSDVWAGLGEVLYGGAPADGDQRTIDAGAAGLAFEPDGASDPYGYSSQREDFAMLFEEAMLAYHFGWERRVGFAARPAEPGGDCREYVVGWGTTSRIAAPPVEPRARRVLELVLGDSRAAFFDALAPPSPIAPGDDLCVDSRLETGSALRWE